MTKPAQADDFDTLSDSVFVWSFYDPAVKCDVYSTALKAHGGLVVFDPAPLADDAWPRLLQIAPLRAILLTNGNHARTADALRQKHKVPIVTAPETRHDLDGLRPDILLLENELLYGISALAIPGATPGETAFYSSENRVMVLGDAVTNLTTEKGLELLPDKYCTDPKQNRESLRKLLDYDVQTLAFAHGSPVTDRPMDKLRALLAS